MYRHRLRPVVACLIMWYRCISVMLLFSFEIWKKKSINNSWSIIISGDLLRLLRYIKVPLTTRQRLRVFVPGRKECLYSACSRSLRAWWLPSSRRREVVVSSLWDRLVKRSNQCKYFHFFFLFSYSSLDSNQWIFCLLLPQSLTTHACRRMMKDNFTQLLNFKI